jgi:hypothetical protein
MTPQTDMERRVAEQQAKRASASPRPHVNAMPQPGRKGRRWEAFNSFVDVVAPRLSLAERAVWLVMFRHARGWVVETSVRHLSQGAAVSRSTAEASLVTLVQAGLVWPIVKSSHKGTGSKYGIHPDPSACLARLLKAAEPSRPSGRLKKRTVPIGAQNRPDDRDKNRKQKGRRLACRPPRPEEERPPA